MPPLLERNRKRFSEIKLSSSKRPKRTFNQRLFFRLSKRIQAASKCQTAVESDEGKMVNEIFLKSVPAVQRSMPERSNPDWFTFPATSKHGVLKHPGEESITWWSADSRCHCGVMRNEMGK